MTGKYPSSLPLLLAFCSGLLLFLASPGLGLRGVTAYFALVPLLFALRRSRGAGGGFLLGLATGLTWYIPLLYWIVIVLGIYGFMPLYFTIPALLLLALYMSLYPALFAFLLCRRTSFTIPLLLVAPCLWIGLDYLRSFLFTGFPWQDLGYSQYQNTLLLQAADLVGHHGITFILLLSNVLLFHLAARFCRQLAINTNLEQPHSITVAAVLLFFFLIAGYDSWRWTKLKAMLGNSPRLPVAVIQPNIEQNQKWRPDSLLATLRSLTELTRGVAPEIKRGLVIWPETALPFYPQQNLLTEKFISPLLLRYDISLLTGTPYRLFDDRRGREVLYNRALLLEKKDAPEQSYDKQHLVPFGEYVPLRTLLPFFAPVVETMMDFSPGPEQPPISCGNVRIGVLICFESIFPALARRHVQNGAQLLVNMTNDAWFGRSLAADQHFSMAVLRAVENRRSLARAANTGISGFIDPLGRIIRASPIFEIASLTAGLPVLEGRTFFIDYGFFFAPCCLLFAAFFVLGGFRRREGRPSPSSKRNEEKKWLSTPSN